MTRSSFESRLARPFLAVALGAVITSPAVAGNANDDLQAVRKAVLASSASEARPPAEDPAGQPPAEARPQARGKGEPMWFRVRVVDKSHKRARVSINLPIGLVRSLGDDWPIRSDRGCRKRDRCGATIGDLLRALDSGQALVDIEDDEATVRVWVE
jgi:hypothetical protein